MSERDLILAKIVAGSLESAAREMSAVVTRTARSPLFNEAHDFTTGIFDLDAGGQARLIAQAPGCTLHLYAICPAVQAALAAFGSDLHPGDVLLASDPYDGGTHIPDHVLIVPVFVGGRPRYFPVVRAHLADVGGPVPGGYNPRALDIWQDGVVMPPIKLYERGRRRDDLYHLVLANNRLPHWLEGDLAAMRGACAVAERRIHALLRRHGEAVTAAAIEHNLDYTERRVRAEIARWQDGCYSAETFADHDYHGHLDIRVRCTATVQGSDLSIDFAGTSAQVDGFINSPLANTLSFVFVAITSCCDEDIPINEGYMRPLRVTAPSGSLVNPQHPRPVGNCTCISGAEIAESVLLALSQCAPQRVGVNCHKLPLCYTSGDYADGSGWVNLNFFGYTGGAGAAYGTDGWGLYPPLMTGVILPSIEVSERQYPLRILRHEYLADRTGAGRWRGAPGVETLIEYQVATRNQVLMAGVRHPSRGFCGGGDGAPNQLALIAPGQDPQRFEQAAYDHALPAGARLHFIRGGGGGWGDPRQRPRAEVLDDVRNGYLSAAAAWRDYGQRVEEGQ